MFRLQRRAGSPGRASWLTDRGRALLAVGATLTGSGLALGFVDLTRVGLLCLVLPLLFRLAARFHRPELEAHREAAPEPLEVGLESTVRVRVRHLRRRGTGLAAHDETSPSLATDGVTVLLEPADPRDEHFDYRVRPRRRGVARLGPLVVRDEDPFGLTRVTHVTAGTTDVLVLPALHALSGGPGGGGGLEAAGREPGHRVTPSGDPDVAIREYRDGDDVRRIHWPATAHRGRLIVRQDSHPSPSGATLIVDSTFRVVRGASPRDREAVGGALDHAVEALASMAVHLGGLGHHLRVVTPASGREGRPDAVVGEREALERLALARPEASSPGDARAHPHGTGPGSREEPLGPGLVVAATCTGEPAATDSVADAAAPSTGFLLVLDRGAFAPPRGAGPVEPTADARDLAARARRQGWHAIVVTPDVDPPAAWARLREPVA